MHDARNVDPIRRWLVENQVVARTETARAAGQITAELPQEWMFCQQFESIDQRFQDSNCCRGIPIAEVIRNLVQVLSGT